MQSFICCLLYITCIQYAKADVNLEISILIISMENSFTQTSILQNIMIIKCLISMKKKYNEII